MAKKFRFVPDAAAMVRSVLQHERDLAERELYLVERLGAMMSDRDRNLEDYINSLPAAGVGPPGPPGGAAVYQNTTYAQGVFESVPWGTNTTLQWPPLNQGPELFTYSGGVGGRSNAFPINPGLYIVTGEFQRQTTSVPVQVGTNIYTGGAGNNHSSDQDWFYDNNAAFLAVTAHGYCDITLLPVPVIQLVVNQNDPTFANRNYRCNWVNVNRIF